MTRPSAQRASDPATSRLGTVIPAHPDADALPRWSPASPPRKPRNRRHLWWL